MRPENLLLLTALNLFNCYDFCYSQVYLQNPSLVSIIKPLKYDLTIQIPIVDDENPTNPAFIGSLFFEFQLDYLVEQSRNFHTDASPLDSYFRPSLPVYSDSVNEINNDYNPIFGSNQDDSGNHRNITFDRLITETRLRTTGLTNFESVQSGTMEKNNVAIFPSVTTGSVKMSARNLAHFENVTLTLNSEEIVIIDIHQNKNEIEFLTDRELQPGRYVLFIEQYTGRFDNTSGVFFRNVGKTSTLISANLFPSWASSVFPCIDSFSTRTQFQLTLLHPINTTAISNTLIIEGPEFLADFWLRTKFAATPIIPPYLFGFTLLPVEYKSTISSSGPLLLTIYANTLTILDDYVGSLVDVTNSAIIFLTQMLNEDLELSKLDVVLVPNIDEVVQTYGVIVFDEDTLLNSDEANMIFSISQHLSELWIGGLTNIGAPREYCFMKDLSGYVAMKALKFMTNGDERYATFRMAHYLKIQMAENFISLSESLTLPSQIHKDYVNWRCNLKGIIMLESLETIIGEKALFNHIRTILRSQKYASFTLDDFLSLLRGYIVDGGINLAQVYDFWQKNGGFPAISATLNNGTMRLIQLNHGRLAKMGSFTWIQMPTWPLRLTLSSAPSPLYFMITEGLDLAPMPDYTLSMINLGFTHFYRVNYDIDVWRQIQSIMRNNPDQFTKQSRAQLINDFCYFNSQGMHEEGNVTEEVRQGWVSLIRDQPTKFDLCEWYIYGCEAGIQRTVRAMKEAKEALWEMESEVRDAFLDSQRYGCGTGSSGTVANKVCDIIYGTDCL